MLAGEASDRHQVGQAQAALRDHDRVQHGVGREDALAPLLLDIGRRGHHRQDRAVQVHVLLDRVVTGHNRLQPRSGYRVGLGALPLLDDRPAGDRRVLRRQPLGNVQLRGGAPRERATVVAGPARGHLPHGAARRDAPDDGSHRPAPGGHRLHLQPARVQDEAAQDARVAVRPQGRDQAARRVPHENDRLVVALLADNLDGLADLLVVHGQVVRVADRLVGAQGAPVLAHVQRVERGPGLSQVVGHLRLEEVVVAPVQVQDRHAGVCGRGRAHKGRHAGALRVLDQLDRARLVPLAQDVGAPVGAGRADLAPGGHDVALGRRFVRRGRGLHPGKIG